MDIEGSQLFAIDLDTMRSFIIFAFLSVSLFAATPEAEISAADQAWATAVKSRNIHSLEKIFTTELIYGHASGAIETKQKYLDRLKTGKQRYDSLTIESTKIVVYGTSAMSHSITRATGVNDSGPFNDHLMMMHFWVKQEGAWRLAGHQTAKIQ